MSLLSEDELRGIKILAKRLRMRAARGLVGERIARTHGSGADFAEHRPYALGDELRSVDFRAFARSGAPVTKLFHKEVDAHVRVAIDLSASMDFGEPTKAHAAARFAAALLAMAEVTGERCTVLTLSGKEARPHVGSMGRHGLAHALSSLEGLTWSGETHLGDALQSLFAYAKVPGMLVLVSDFFDTSPWERALVEAQARGHEVSLVHVLSRSEMSPEWEGELELVDSETGATVSVVWDPEVAQAHESRFFAHESAILAFAVRHGMRKTRLASDESLVLSLARFVNGSDGLLEKKSP